MLDDLTMAADSLEMLLTGGNQGKLVVHVSDIINIGFSIKIKEHYIHLIFVSFYSG